MQSKKFYPAKFEPPKKVTKEKKLSDNIRKFLAQKAEEEERQKIEKKRKYEDLMSARSESEKNKIRKMLKVTKSANRSVLDDVDKRNTSITLDGLEQPDEDDYGYTSTEVSSIHQNLMNKYKSIPEDNKFNMSSRKNTNGSRIDLNSTKDRVKSAIMREKEEEKLGRKRLSSSTTIPISSGSTNGNSHSSEHRRSRKNLYDPGAEREEERRRQIEEDRKRREKLKRSAPPPMDFQHLLKLAEQKQYEPVEVEVPIKKETEPERLLTNKQKRQLEEKKKFFEERERRKNGSHKTSESDKLGKIPKLNSTSGSRPTNDHSKTSKTLPVASSSSSILKNSLLNGRPSPSTASTKPNSSSRTQVSQVSSRPNSSNGIKVSFHDRPRDSNRNLLPKGSHLPATSKNVADMRSRELLSKDMNRNKGLNSRDQIKNKDLPSKNIVKSREFPPKDVVRTREFPPRAIITREFPPRDVIKTRDFPPRDIPRNGNGIKRKPQSLQQKRRILDDDDESEYDSEMDDFIDDDDDANDYSKHIKEIFGYDKSKYRYVDDDEDDNMESNFAQQQREELISKRIGLMEDLEDMRMEEEEKARKRKRQHL